jgi:2-amino-4-hydroxy-6-hydroxymethyldihydropteridine diphosphokinase
MNKAYIALGTNMGERLENLKKALELIDAVDGLEIKYVSSVYETKPVGGPEQGNYLNACALIKSELTPTLLLLKLLEIESKIGRVREERWGPRIIDLDLLVYENVTMNSPLLELPHPRLTERDFVLIPLCDIAPDLVITGSGKTVYNLLSTRPKSDDVTRYSDLVR